VSKLLDILESWIAYKREEQKREWQIKQQKNSKDFFLHSLQEAQGELEKAKQEVIKQVQEIAELLEENISPYVSIDIKGLGMIKVHRPSPSYPHVKQLVVEVDGEHYHFIGEPGGTITRLVSDDTEGKVKVASFEQHLSLIENLEEIIKQAVEQQDEQSRRIRRVFHQLNAYNTQPDLDTLSRWNVEKAEGFVIPEYAPDYKYDQYVFVDNYDQQGQRYGIIIIHKKFYYDDEKIFGYFTYDGRLHSRRALETKEFKKGDSVIELDYMNIGRFKGKGIGTALLTCFEYVVRRLGISTIKVPIHQLDYEDNSSAIEKCFVEKKGYTWTIPVPKREEKGEYGELQKDIDSMDLDVETIIIRKK
jgi:GNAT superfamily N-acetyltransferase